MQAIVRPLKFFGGTRRVRRQVVSLWLLAAICCIPQLIVMVQTEERRLSPDASQYISLLSSHGILFLSVPCPKSNVSVLSRNGVLDDCPDLEDTSKTKIFGLDLGLGLEKAWPRPRTLLTSALVLSCIGLNMIGSLLFF